MSEIMTYTKKMFDPLYPKAELIDIEDIAHALSMLCRANGHFRSFYSVAQHSINCMKEAEARGYSDRIQLACLLHDASEAYLSDVTRPVKAELPRYKEIESPLQEMIWNKWLDEPLSTQELIQVFQIDDAILVHEFLNLMGEKITDQIPEICSVPQFAFPGFEQCKREFLSLFRRLTSDKKEYFVVGIDWMKPYWLAVEIQNGELSVQKLKHIEEINDRYKNADALLIDIPIGLPENNEEASLRPDMQARAYLQGARKSSIFNVLYRQIVHAETTEQAWELNRELNAKMAIVGDALRPMIREVDDFLAKDPNWKNRLMESHPEVAFQMLNGGNGLQHSKHTDAGIQERITILQRHGVDPISLFTEFTPKQYEDVLDALCLAVSAKLGCENGFCTVPENPACDSRGLKMQMIFGKIANPLWASCTGQKAAKSEEKAEFSRFVRFYRH